MKVKPARKRVLPRAAILGTAALALLALALPVGASAHLIGGVTEFSAGLNPGAAPQLPTAGPDGNVWFTDLGSTKAIGRVTPSGTISEFSSEVTKPDAGMTSGSDGNIWFADRTGKNEVQKVAFSSFVAGDKYVLTCPEVTEVKTAEISYATGLTGKNNLKNALNAACGENFSFSGNPPGVTVTMELKYGNANVPNMKCEKITGSGSCTVEGLEPGAPNSIAKMNTSGAVLAHYSTGLNAGSRPNLMTEGSDGNVWFSDSLGLTKAMGRITPSGEITEFSTPAVVTPGAVTTGSDGNVWFIASGAEAGVGRITPSGEITTYLNLVTGTPSSIATGPDGKIWFTEIGVNTAIARCDPSNCSATVEEFEAGLPEVSNPSSIVAGPDEMWFGDYVNGALGRVKVNGSITELSVGEGTSPASLAYGADGNIWFTQVFSSAISKATLTEGQELTLNIEEGEGSVVSNPAGLECSGEAPTSCSEEFETGKEVTLTASPAPGYIFKSWKKCDSGGVNGRQCTVTTSSAKEVGAKFVKVWSLDVSKAGSGTGKAQTSPGGILCLYNCGSAEAVFKAGSVTVKQAAAKHNHFVQWLGDCTGSEPTCVLSMTEDHSVEAEFAPDTQYTLSLSKEGGGQGSVKSKPSGLLCAYTCASQSASFYSGETIEIEVKLNKGTTKLEWTTGAGTCTGSTEAPVSTCTVPMSSAQALVADFS